VPSQRKGGKHIVHGCRRRLTSPVSSCRPAQISGENSWRRTGDWSLDLEQVGLCPEDLGSLFEDVEDLILGQATLAIKVVLEERHIGLCRIDRATPRTRGSVEGTTGIRGRKPHEKNCSSVGVWVAGAWTSLMTRSWVETVEPSSCWYQSGDRVSTRDWIHLQTLHCRPAGCPAHGGSTQGQQPTANEDARRRKQRPRVQYVARATRYRHRALAVQGERGRILTTWRVKSDSVEGTVDCFFAISLSALRRCSALFSAGRSSMARGGESERESQRDKEKAKSRVPLSLSLSILDPWSVFFTSDTSAHVRLFPSRS
jgi:hypothetical protein